MQIQSRPQCFVLYNEVSAIENVRSGRFHCIPYSVGHTCNPSLPTSNMYTQYNIQWSLPNMDTFGTKESDLLSEVSSLVPSPAFLSLAVQQSVESLVSFLM